jgi:formyltetrahydrofolate synthetase
MHGGGPAVSAGKPLDYTYLQEDLKLLRKGMGNLLHHISIARKFGVPVVVAVNQFYTDTQAELELVRTIAVEEGGAVDAVISNHWGLGGKGSTDLAKAVVIAAEKPSEFKFLYPLDWPIKKKIEIIAKEIYGAAGVEYSKEAEERIAKYTQLGFSKLPICMAKTHLSLSHDPKLKGVPEGFIIPIRDVRASVGAGFLYPVLGKISTMPGLSTRPAFMDIDIDLATGKIIGLS